jgi:acyl-coenzyme A thioesterase PaaI-like protein
MSVEFSGADRSQLLRLVGGLKRAIHCAVALGATGDTLRALADRAEEFAGALEPLSGKRPLPLFSSNPIDLPFSPVTGPLNPVSPETEITIEGEEAKRVIARVRFSNVYEGPPRHVHGGHVAAMFDQILAFANRVNGAGGLTASLTCRYRKPTPLDTDLRFEAWIERREDPKVFTRCECRAGDDLLAECEGVFVRIDAERARRLFSKPGTE